VVGLGLAGLMAGLAATRAGARTLLVGKGYGTTHFRSGTLDVLGYVDGRTVASPAEALGRFVASHADHPYARAGSDLGGALDVVREAMREAGREPVGELAANVRVATAAGTLRPSCVVQPTMALEWADARVLAVGLAGYRDFDAGLFAAVFPDQAARQDLELSVRGVRVTVPQLQRRHLDGLTLARLFDQVTFRRQLIEAVRPHLGDATVAAFPAVLGLHDAPAVAAELRDALGVPVAELPTLPPSVPGMRLQHALEAALRRRGARVQIGARATVRRVNGHAESLEVAAAAHPVRVPVRTVVLATGGLASDGLRVEGSGALVEPAAQLPVAGPGAGDGTGGYGDAFLGRDGHEVGRGGVRVDAEMRPLDAGGAVVCDNLFACGGLLAGAQRPVERSADGIAAATGYVAGRAASAEAAR
jgi:glycerol-3-phosphate dehydrogenase subunit B